MRLTWIGHSCFLVQPRTGPSILHDPYATPGCGTYEPVDVAADVVTVSHSYDATWHGDLTHVRGEPVVLEDLYGERAEAGGVGFESLRTFHSEARERPNTTLWYDVDDLRVAHLGDLGHPLAEDELEAMGDVDVVLAPASGVYVIEPEDLVPVLRTLDPGIVVPMHVKNDRIDLGMGTMQGFLDVVEDLTDWPADRPGASGVELTRGTMPGDGPRVVVLEPAR